MKTFHSFLKELEATVTYENTAIYPYLTHINSLLHNAVLTCRAAATECHCQAKIESEKEFVAPGKKMEHQWRFKQTSRTPGRKKKGVILRSVDIITCI